MSEPVIPECICHRASPILCLVHRDSLVIPERYAEEYCAVTNAEHIPYRKQERIIYELGAAEAKVAELTPLLAGFEAKLKVSSDHFDMLNARVAEQAATIERLTAGGVGLIAQERLRQVEQEGWTAEHDDEHLYGELAKRAAALAIYHTDATVVDDGEEVRPWKKHRAPRSLVIAGALIAAEIDRLFRAALSKQELSNGR